MTTPTVPPSAPRAPSALAVSGITAVVVVSLLVGVVVGPRLANAWERLFPQDSASAAATSDGGATVWYQSQMHPWVIQPYPGNCPICGMDLTPVDPARFGAEVTIAPITVQNIGIRSQQVQRAPLRREIRTVGIVEWDPARIHEVNLRAGGWVERIAVAAPGDRVRVGEPLFYLSSPQLDIAQSELLRARDERSRQASLQKLAWLGMRDGAAIQELEEAGQPLSWVPISSPLDGLVLSRDIVEGGRVEVGSTALRLVDDSQLWLNITLFEHQLAGIAEGQEARITLLDGQELNGSIAYIEPMINARTRALQARVVVANAERQLRYGSYARVHLPLSEGDADEILIPRASVVASGKRQVVFLDLGRGRYAPREVRLGVEDDHGNVAIVDGLAEGERVVTSGQFLIDAESRMIEAIARMIFPERFAAEDAEASEVPSGPMADLLAAYAAVAEALYADNAEAASALSDPLLEAVRSAELPAELLATASALAEHDGLSELRYAFGALSMELRDLLRDDPQPAAKGWQVIHCGMAPAPDDGWWLQADGETVRNPYFGARHGMRACAVSVEPLPEAAATSDDEELSALTVFMNAYADLAQALYGDDFAAAQEVAITFAPLHEAALPELAGEQVQALAEAADLGQLRYAFGTLSISLRDHLRAHPAPELAGWQLIHCGMAPAPDDGWWLQADGETVRNPYFGARHGMRACAILVEDLLGDAP